MMALGTHWEWRGFGAVSGIFAERYCNLEPFYEPQTIEDIYLWIPGMQINAKFRTGVEDGLKFKRIKNKDDDLEQWTESPNELFEFPIDTRGWNALKGVLAEVGLKLPDYPSRAPNRADSLRCLEEIGCRILQVNKIRETKIWRCKPVNVMVEWACITSPQSCISIGLETMEMQSGDEQYSDDEQKRHLTRAVRKMGLKKEPIKVMNYIDAVRIWASGGVI
jgi:hypothetical protein